jgi:hypothetical protein
MIYQFRFSNTPMAIIDQLGSLQESNYNGTNNIFNRIGNNILFVPDSSWQKIQPLKVENIIWKDLPAV